MEFDRQYDDFWGRRGVPPRDEECVMWSAGWARGVLMVMEQCGMKLRGANPGHGVPMGLRSTSLAVRGSLLIEVMVLV